MQSGYKQSQANLAAADANVRRLEQLEGFKNVYAPFSGVLTRRNVDPGALINAGSGDWRHANCLTWRGSIPCACTPAFRRPTRPT